MPPKIKTTPKIRSPPKIKAPSKAKVKIPSKERPPQQNKKNDSLYEQITDSTMANDFYDTITSKDFLNYSADFIKALAGIWLYRAVYNAAAPPQPPPPPVLRGTIIPSRRGVVIPPQAPNDDNFGLDPEDVIIESGVDTSNLSRDEMRQLHEFAEGSTERQPTAWNDVVDINNSNAEAIANLRSRVREVLRRSDTGNGLMEDIKSFKLSDRAKQIGKDAFKALLLAGITGAVGAYSVHAMDRDRNINYDAERADPIQIPHKSSPYDYSENTRNWTNKVKNKRVMNSILNEFDDLSEDVSSLSSNFSSDGSYGLGLKKIKISKSKSKKKVDSGKIIDIDIKVPDVINDPKISKINDKLKEAVLYIYSKAPSKEVIMTFMTVIFALGTALLFANSQPLTDDLLNKIMDFKRILNDCIAGSVSVKGVQAYVGHYLEQILNFGINSYTDTFGGKLKSPKKIKEPKMKEIFVEIPTGFYETRIKPIAKKAYDAITSDETITVAKTLAQVAFLSLVMYGIKELGTVAYNAIPRPDDDQRTSSQHLEDMANEEIARATNYIGTSGRNRGKDTEYDKSGYPRDWPQDVGTDSPYHEDYNPTISKINRILSNADRDIYQSKGKTDKLIEVLRGENPIHTKNLMLKHEILRDTEGRKPHKFTTEFAEQLPTEDEIEQYDKLKKASGKGLKEDAYKLSKEKIAKLKKIAKKIYEKIKSKEGKHAIAGVTVATILAGLTALIHNKMNNHMQLSPSELKEQYMNNLGENILFQ